MKKWVKKLRGIAFAALLTVALSGKAYAETDEGQIPETPPQFIAPASETASPDAAAPVSENDVPAEETQQSSDGSADDGDEVQTPSNEFAAMPAAGSSATAGSPDGTDTVPGASDLNDNGDTVPTVTTDPSDNGDTAPAVMTDTNENGDVVPAVTTDSNDSGEVVPTVTTDPNDGSDVVPTVTTDPSGNGDTASTMTAVNTSGNGDGDPVLTTDPSDGDDGNTVVTTDPSGDSDVVPTDTITTAFGTSTGISGSNDTVGATDGTSTDDGQTDPTTLPPADGTDPDGAGDTGDPSEPDPGTDPSFQQVDENVYVIVNHDGTENLESEGDMTVLAAGLNHVSSISSGGTVTVTGSGILLVDSLEGDLDFETLQDSFGTDIYDEGSVAVFVWNAEYDEEGGGYVLSNGGVPGILDEDYYLGEYTGDGDVFYLQNVLGYRFIIPTDETLLLCGTGAEPIYDEEGNLTGVNYYHGAEHGYRPTDHDNIIEQTGTLTIGEGAELVVEYRGNVIIENLNSMGWVDTHDGCRHPELIVADGGTLTLETFGQVYGEAWGGDERNHSSGTVTFEPGSTLAGEGYVNVSIIRFMGPDAVSDSDVWLTAEHIYLNGSGTYEGLEISDSVLHVGDGVSVSGLGILDTQGTTCIVLSGGQTLDIARVEGINVSIRVNAMENWQTGEDLTVTITGDIESRSPDDSPTISLDSGIFILAKGTTLTDVLLNPGGAVIYDYAGLLDENLALLVIHPDDLTPADGNGDVIPVSGAYVTEWPERGRANYYIINELGEDTSIEALSGEDPELFIALHDNGNGLQDLIDAYLTQIVPEDKVLGNGLILAVQILRMDSDGTLSFEEYTLYPNTPLPEEFNADGAVAVRLLFYDAVSFVEPATPGTHTGKTFTGSGILGGYGNNNGNGNGDNGNGNGNGDNGNGNGDNGNGNGNGDNGNGNGNGDNGNGNGNGDNGNGNGDNGNGNGDNGNGNGNGNGDNGNGNGNGDNGNGNGNGNGDNGNGNGNGDNGNGNGDNGNGNGNGNGDNGNGNGNGDNGNGNGNGDNGNENGENGNENADNGNGQDGNQDAASVQTGGVTNSSFWVEQVTAGESYVLHAEEGEETLSECGGKVKVVIHRELSAEDAVKTMYAVFRAADGTLKAFRVSYSRLKSELSFETDMLGDFTLVAFDFDGEEYSPEFYEALEQIVEI